MKELFFTFFKIGLFTFGGGYAMIPLIEKEIIENKKWIKEDELLEIISISQMTPGPIAINAATFIGKKYKGFLGAIVATSGVILPSFLIITLIAYFFSNSFLNPYVQKAFTGLRAGIVALIFSSVFKLSKKSITNFFETSIFCGAIFLLVYLNISPIYLILFFGFFSIFISFFKNKEL